MFRHGIFQKKRPKVILHKSSETPLALKEKGRCKTLHVFNQPSVSPRFSLRQEHGQGGPNQGTPNRQGERMVWPRGSESKSPLVDSWIQEDFLVK